MLTDTIKVEIFIGLSSHTFLISYVFNQIAFALGPLLS